MSKKTFKKISGDLIEIIETTEIKYNRSIKALEEEILQIIETLEKKKELLKEIKKQIK